VEWFDGEFYPPAEVRALYTAAEYPPESAMLIGTDGALLNAHGSMPVLLPEAKFRGYAKPKTASRNHYHHFADACLGGEATACHFAQTGPMTEAILLGTVAIRVPDQQLDWSAPTMSFPNHPAADRHLRRSYRQGWSV
jgi:hypothetical protein